MLKLSEEQCAGMEKMEDADLVRDTARRLKQKLPGLSEPDESLHVRLDSALEYGNALPLKEKKAVRDFLLLEAFYPGFYLKTAVDKWLKRVDGYSAEQRVKDLKHVMINRAGRKREW